MRNDRNSTTKKPAGGRGLIPQTSARRRSAAGGLFQLCRRSETQTLRRLDLDRFAGLRIAAQARAPFRNAKRAEGPDLIGAAIAFRRLESCLDGIEHKFDVTLGL